MTKIAAETTTNKRSGGVSLSTSKLAVQLMNTTNLCAHPTHFHSFSAIDGDGSWALRSPRSLFIAAFEKCSGCQGRLGANPVISATDDAEKSFDKSYSSLTGTVQCVACGVYAHRSCAFRQTTQSTRSLLSPCEINLPLVKKAIGELPSKTDETVKNEIVATSCNDEQSTDPVQEEEELSSNCLEEETNPAPVEDNEKKDPTARTMFQTSVEIVKKTSETTKRIPKASAVGMVAGGVAGLAIAGPAGCIVGSQIGRTALAVGAAIEGGMGIGVLVMSLAAAANLSLTSKKDRRELKLLEQGSKTLVLVRPEIECDPRWVVYADEARQSWERMSKESSSGAASSSIGSFFLSSNDNHTTTPDLRYSKDADIIKADSTELAVREKVFLLVNRILNDKMSLPGYVYRHLILKHKRMKMFDENVAVQSLSDNETDANASRICRTNAHNIIKHVTATLLEVRPGLSSSSVMTELSADAVELLVFGELYDDIYEEFVQQTKEQDSNLSSKVRRLSDIVKENTVESEVESSTISQPAVAALRALPQAHTPTDKLSHCVAFLEAISEHFSTLYQGKCIDADTLLVMVCQHVVASNVNHLHAEVAFLEEFSRDVQLLSGKEGYALITLLASLHYLESLEEFFTVIGPIR
mmetsp:Transcript_19806/g.32503  ORF Transcript_19806/g.32503 Transcript_19806/m.32503 type:complete len:640 (+) Transcript_19806:181-2100(+)